MNENEMHLELQSFTRNICEGFLRYQQNGDFVDMTLAAEGHLVKVHKNILSLSSPYIEEMLRTVPCKHPVLFLNNITHAVLSCLLEYIYTGTTNVPKDKFAEFITACKHLQIIGVKDFAPTSLVTKISRNKSAKAVKRSRKSTETEPNITTETTVEGNAKCENGIINIENNRDMENADSENGNTDIENNHDMENSDFENGFTDIENNHDIENADYENDIENNHDMDMDIEPDLKDDIKPINEYPDETPTDASKTNDTGSNDNAICKIDLSNIDVNSNSNYKKHTAKFITNTVLNKNTSEKQTLKEVVKPINEYPDETLIDASESTAPGSNNNVTDSNTNTMYKIDLSHIDLNTNNNNTKQAAKSIINSLLHENTSKNQPRISNTIKPTEKTIINSVRNENVFHENAFQFPENASENQSLTNMQANTNHTKPKAFFIIKPVTTNKNKFASHESIANIPQNSAQFDYTINNSVPHTNHVKPATKLIINSVPNEQNYEIEESVTNIQGDSSQLDYSVNNSVPYTNHMKPAARLIINSVPNEKKFHTEESFTNIQGDSAQHSLPMLPYTNHINPAAKLINSVPNGKMFETEEAVKNIPEDSAQLDYSTNDSLPYTIQVKPAAKLIINSIPNENIFQSQESVANIQENAAQFDYTTNYSAPCITQNNGANYSTEIYLPQEYSSETPVSDQYSIQTSVQVENVPTSLHNIIIQPLQNDAVNETNSGAGPSNVDDVLSDDKGKKSLELKGGATILYTLSTRGAVQLLLNRYLYSVHHKSFNSRKRRWRCIDYRHNKCNAYIDTDDEKIIARVNEHNHGFHDEEILKKGRRGAVFTSLLTAIEESHKRAGSFGGSQVLGL